MENKNVYTARKVGSTFSTQTISQKNVSQAKKAGAKYSKRLRKNRVDKQKQVISYAHSGL